MSKIAAMEQRVSEEKLPSVSKNSPKKSMTFIEMFDTVLKLTQENKTPKWGTVAFVFVDGNLEKIDVNEQIRVKLPLFLSTDNLKTSM